MKAPPIETREPRKRGSLRSELLYRLAFLAAAALLLGIWTARVLERLALAAPWDVGALLLLVGLDALVFVALGDAVLRRVLLRPLGSVVCATEAIADGDYERRAPSGDTAELHTIARAVNRLTDQLLRNQERLAENVRSLNETNQRLTETQRELLQAEKLASIGRLAAGVAHEIGNPLGALMGYTGVLRRRSGGGELVDGLEREARRIDQIVRGLLDYARPASARREPVDIGASLHRVLDLLRTQGRLGGVRVRLEAEPDMPPVEAAPHRIDQLFVNLISNAEAAMDGEGELVIVARCERYTPGRRPAVRRADDPPGVDYSHLRRARHGAVRDAASLQPGREVVRVVVADTGPGIPEDRIDTVFDPFFTTKEPGQGTGLGLAIVASTVAELGGRIEVTSAKGGGATFTLSLPTIEPT